MNLKSLCIIAAASTSLAITPAAIGAEAPKTGPFTGQTSQGKSIKLNVEAVGLRPDRALHHDRRTRAV